MTTDEYIYKLQLEIFNLSESQEALRDRKDREISQIRAELERWKELALVKSGIMATQEALAQVLK